jgi:hypothetical protein
MVTAGSSARNMQTAPYSRPMQYATVITHVRKAGLGPQRGRLKVQGASLPGTSEG